MLHGRDQCVLDGLGGGYVDGARPAPADIGERHVVLRGERILVVTDGPILLVLQYVRWLLQTLSRWCTVCSSKHGGQLDGRVNTCSQFVSAW